MDERTLQVFFEIHTNLPREGPGSYASTRQAFSLLTDLPDRPRILDIGCGPGMQTLDLAGLTAGSIVAVDNHQPYLDSLTSAAARRGLTDRIEVVNADMAALDFPHDSFDVIWAEGSAYSMGFELALRTWRPLLRTPGFVAVSEVAWTTAEVPENLRRFWAEEYPAMRDIDSNLALIRRAGYRMMGHFALPESDWWEHYYSPLQDRLESLRSTYAGDSKALAVVQMHEREIQLYRDYSDNYAYVFFIMAKD